MRGGRNKFGTYYKQDRASRMKQYQERNKSGDSSSMNNNMSPAANYPNGGQYSPEQQINGNSRKRTPVAEVSSR